jgi:formylglycine-generating enzyme required for sulfatase activity
MKKESLYLFIIMISITASFLQCGKSNNLKRLEPSNIHSITIDNTSPISLITIIPKGEKATFLMGTTKEELKNQPTMDHTDYYTDDEQPAHNVTLTIPYEISKYEITNEQFCRVMNWAIEKNYAKIIDGDLKSPDGKVYLGIMHLDGGGYLSIQFGIRTDGDSIITKKTHELHPVHGITWFGAIAFCNFLSEMKGLSPVYNLETSDWDTTKNGFRLPTEAEWEYAARKDKRYTYAWGNEIDTRYLNYGPSQSRDPNKCVFKPIGFYNGEAKEGIETKDNASPFGIYDMTGNVWEWCWDWYGRDYYKNSSLKDPKGSEKGDNRLPYNKTSTKVWRGCGWAGNDAFSRIAKRWSASPNTAINETGFRIARSLFY